MRRIRLILIAAMSMGNSTPPVVSAGYGYDYGNNYGAS